MAVAVALLPVLKLMFLPAICVLWVAWTVKVGFCSAYNAHIVVGPMLGRFFRDFLD